jgi:hypothetical protein
LPATAAIDNETLDHLLSVVDDAAQSNERRRNGKSLRGRVSLARCGISPACEAAGRVLGGKKLITEIAGREDTRFAGR